MKGFMAETLTFEKKTVGGEQRLTTILSNGLIVILPRVIRAETDFTDYERLTLVALQTIEGFEFVMNALLQNPKQEVNLPIRENWKTTAGVYRDEDNRVTFSLYYGAN